VSCLSLSGPPALCAGKMGFLLKQSSKFSGPQSIFVSADGVKISEANTGITYICRQPAWRWQIFNQRTHKYFECAPDAFKGTAGERMVIFLHDRLVKTKFAKLAPAKILGEPVDRFRTPLASGLNDPGEPDGNRRYFEVSLLAHAPLPKSVQAAVGRVHGLPLEGVPVQVIYLDEFDSIRQALLTIRLDPKAIDKSTFATPHNYSSVKKEQEVYIDEERDKDVTQLLDQR
jgi:hypothetical protein